MATATHDACIVFPSEAFHPKATLHAVRDYACTTLYGVPTMFVAEPELLSSGAVPSTSYSSLRTGIAAGSSVPAELMRKLHKTLNLTKLCISYGMTKISPVSTMTTTDDPMEKHPDSIGHLMPHVKAKVVDPANRSKILGLGEKGKLAVSGYLVMRGYWEDPERTNEVMYPDYEGTVWMHVSPPSFPYHLHDLFSSKWIAHTYVDRRRRVPLMDAEGYVKITGRIKDVIIRSGENVHPLEIEKCLFGHDDMAEASVVGVPDERYGDIVAAFIIPHQGTKITANDVRNWVREKPCGHLAPKCVFWVDSYPKTASGKIQKFKLREQGVQLLKVGKGLN